MWACHNKSIVNLDQISFASIKMRENCDINQIELKTLLLTRLSVCVQGHSLLVFKVVFRVYVNTKSHRNEGTSDIQS